MKENRLIVASKGWAESIPEWLLKEVESERFVNGMINIIKPLAGKDKVGDAEVVCYLFTHGLVSPMTSEFTNIYIHLLGKILKKREMPITEDMEKLLEKGLSEYENVILNDLKYRVYNLRGGDIKNPIFDMLKKFKKESLKGGKKKYDDTRTNN